MRQQHTEIGAVYRAVSVNITMSKTNRLPPPRGGTPGIDPKVGIHDSSQSDAIASCVCIAEISDAVGGAASSIACAVEALAKAVTANAPATNLVVDLEACVRRQAMIRIEDPSGDAGRPVPVGDLALL
ncbi:MAG: hypothetical protein KDA22_16865, partial [Phycisphaerales bacterium]|nr:hypothetical protein [Phycisphaerales bacterium]